MAERAAAAAAAAAACMGSRASPVGLRVDHELPFSLAGLQALRQAASAAPLQLQPHHCAQVVPTGVAKVAPCDQQALLAAERRRDPVDRQWRAAMLVLTLLVVTFIGVVVTLISMVFVRINHVLDRVDGKELTEKMNHMLDHAMQSAVNTEAATSNMAQATAVAHALAQQIHPRVEHALNATEAVVDHLRDFSFHPKWTISAGGLGG